MRRTRRNRQNENPMIEAIKYWQRSATRALVFVGLPVALTFVAFALWVGTPAGQEFMGFAEHDRQAEKRLESLQDNMQQRLDEFTESTNQDVQNTINDIEGTQDTSGAEYYNEDVYTAPEMQESVEQPVGETNGVNNDASETQESSQVEKKTTKESEDNQRDNRPEPVPDERKQLKGQAYDSWDDDDNPITEEEE